MSKMNDREKLKVLNDLLDKGKGRVTVADLLAATGNTRRCRRALFVARKSGVVLEAARDKGSKAVKAYFRMLAPSKPVTTAEVVKVPPTTAVPLIQDESSWKDVSSYGKMMPSATAEVAAVRRSYVMPEVPKLNPHLSVVTQGGLIVGPYAKAAKAKTKKVVKTKVKTKKVVSGSKKTPAVKKTSELEHNFSLDEDFDKSDLLEIPTFLKRK